MTGTILNVDAGYALGLTDGRECRPRPHLLLAVTAHGYGHLGPVRPGGRPRWRGASRACESRFKETSTPHVRARQAAAGLRARDREARTSGSCPMDGPLRHPLGPRPWMPMSAFEAQTTSGSFDAPDGAPAARIGSGPGAGSTSPGCLLDAARRLGIPAVALCSLSWYDICASRRFAERDAGSGPRADASGLCRRGSVHPSRARRCRWPGSRTPGTSDLSPCVARPTCRAARPAWPARGHDPLPSMQFGRDRRAQTDLHAWHRQQEHVALAGCGRCRQAAPGRDRAARRLGLGVQDVIGSVDLMLCQAGLRKLCGSGLQRDCGFCTVRRCGLARGARSARLAEGRSNGSRSVISAGRSIGSRREISTPASDTDGAHRWRRAAELRPWSSPDGARPPSRPASAGALVCRLSTQPLAPANAR